MRINHIYITKEGEPMANPEMDFPNPPNDAGFGDLNLMFYSGELGKYHSGLLPFEDRDKLKDEIFYQVTGGPQVDVPFNVMFKPDTLIPVDLEVEVVDDYCGNCGEPFLKHLTGERAYECNNESGKKFEYRKVLHIKP